MGSESLMDYVRAHTDRGQCQCGLCIDFDPSDDPERLGEHTVNMTFFKMVAKDSPDADKLRELINNHKPTFTGEINLFDGKEHNYIELGAWIGDQGAAIALIGLGKILGLWSALTPDSIMPDLPDDLKMKMAQGGMVALQS